MTETTVRNVVIVGGGVAGISLAHHLLRQTLPALAEGLGQSYQVTLISPSSHFYWKVAAPRALVDPNPNFPEPFVSIAHGFQEYSETRFKSIQARATDLEEKSQILHVQLSDTSEILRVKYDSLIIATGTTTHSPFFSSVKTHTETKRLLGEMQTRLRDAKSILVAGGGPTGVETAGEIGAMRQHWPPAKKSITLLSGNACLLSHANPRTSATAEQMLGSLNVDVIHDLRVISAIQKEHNQGPWEITLSDQSTRTVDVYIDATGSTPNTAFLPSSWLDSKGFVKTDQFSLRVQGANGVYALGSVTSFTNGSFFDAIQPVPPLADSFRDDQLALYPELSNRGQTWWEWMFGRQTRSYQQKVALTQFVAVGRDGGVGELGGWRVPSGLVYKAKAKTYMVEKMNSVVYGHGSRRA
ncbi:Apoptosis-inducing factor [Penicillium rolfsii]|nr:Apoptosis-inducing factor [Penicillium rolfsii]